MYALLAVSIQRAEGSCGCFIQGLALHLSGKLAMRSGVQHLEHFATCSPLFFHLERTLILEKKSSNEEERARENRGGGAALSQPQTDG